MYYYYLYSFIDSFQNGKKQIVNNFVLHKESAKLLNKFVDTQTQYTKSACNATGDLLASAYKMSTTTDFTTEMIKTWQEQMQAWLVPQSKTKGGA